MFTPEAQETLRKRLVRGEELIRLSWKGIRIQAEDDFDSAAKDAISDVLTARFGPAGRLVPSSVGDGLKVDLFSDAVENASAMVEAALQSYFGDAEDYLVDAPDPTPEPGQYGYEEPEAKVVTYSQLRDFLSQYADNTGTIQGDPATIAGEAASAGLVQFD